jgi:polysaccharide export outer membrane protein
MTTAHPRQRFSVKVQPGARISVTGLTLATGAAGLYLAFATGCGTPPNAAATMSPTATSTPAEAQAWQQAGQLSEVMTIREGDVLKISFPGASNLDSSQQVRSDGVVTLDIVGEVKVTGLTPKELEKKLAQLYSTQLVSNEVNVAVVSSSFDVFVSGAVLRPGKITTTKPITAFQAIMEAGYDPAVANLQNVMVIREDSRSKYIYLTLNLQLVLEGKDTRPFYLKPSDTIQVSKKVTIF